MKQEKPQSAATKKSAKSLKSLNQEKLVLKDSANKAAASAKTVTKQSAGGKRVADKDFTKFLEDV